MAKNYMAVVSGHAIYKNGPMVYKYQCITHNYTVKPD